MNGKYFNLLASLLAITASQSALAFDPATDRTTCINSGRLCFTSFIWCSTDDVDKNKGCTYPENTWPLNVKNGAMMGRDMKPALVLWNTTYTVSWITDEDEDTQLKWYIGGPLEEKDDGEKQAWWHWTKNFEAGEREFTFKFADIVQEFGTGNNVNQTLTPYDAKAMASAPYNFFQVSQRADIERSGSFGIVDEAVLNLLDIKESNGKNGEKKKWQKGVGIGVGIGVPLLLAVAFFVGRLMGRKRGQPRPVKKIESH